MSYTAPTGLTATPVGLSVPLTWGPSYLIGSAPLLLLHFDGTNGQTTTVDSSPYNWPVTLAGGASLTTSSPEFGTASFAPGAGNFLLAAPACAVPYSSGSTLDIFTTNNWTVEGWVKVTAAYTGGAVKVFTYNDIPNPNTYRCDVDIVLNADGVHGVWRINGGAGASVPVTVGTWYHFALVNIGGGTTTVLYINGVAYITTGGPGFSPASYVYAAGSSVSVGSDAVFNGSSVASQIDEFRVSSYAVYIANFTPPSAPFSGSGSVAPGYDVYRNGVSIDAYIGVPGFTDTVPGPGVYTYTVAGWNYTNATLLLLHFDGTNGQTTTVDSSPAANTVVMNASFASLSTSAPEFGSASLSLPASNKSNSYAVAVPFAYNGALDIFKTNAWTIECFAKVTSTTLGYVFNYGGAQSTPENASFEFTMSDNGAGATSLSLLDNGMFGTGQSITQTISTPSFAWHHIAVVLNAGVTTVYFDGVALTTTKNVWNPTSYSQLNASPNVIIGSTTRLSGTTGPMFIDEFRVSGAANYTANFTPPAAPFTIPGADLSSPSSPYVMTVVSTVAGLQVKFVPAPNYKAIMVANPGNINPRIYPPQVDTTVRVKS